ncbi:MAG: SPOR domain-containing protein [Rothia sp. (in: high G+C Gram-positive bacteria)]|nr:SPOR domain-containing protein [Rothia sp. (in: high G+C Gram-positive bacteria)]
MSLDHITPGPHDPEFYYNLKTGQVEEGQQSPAKDLWGPFKTREEAAAAMDSARKRNEELDAKKDGWF